MPNALGHLTAPESHDLTTKSANATVRRSIRSIWCGYPLLAVAAIPNAAIYLYAGDSLSLFGSNWADVYKLSQAGRIP